MKERKDVAVSKTGFENKPIFTGDYIKDTAVSELEKAAEVSLAIHNVIAVKTVGRKKERQKSACEY